METIEHCTREYVDGMGPAERFCKRFFDFTGAVLISILCAPLTFIVWIALLCQHDGSPIYRQERIGYKGKPFYILKFRSMRKDAENGKPVLAHKGDDRLTPVGKFIREHHLDEIPQLWNVIVGDMSFVGPRPERRFFIERIEKENPDYCIIYRMRPGITSHATLYNGYTDTMDKMLTRLQMDLDYYEHRNWLMDIRLLTCTFFSIVFGKKF